MDHPGTQEGVAFRPRPAFSWRVKLRCEGPTHGGEMAGAAWQRYGMAYWFEYDPATGDIELEVRGWNTSTESICSFSNA